MTSRLQKQNACILSRIWDTQRKAKQTKRKKMPSKEEEEERSYITRVENRYRVQMDFALRFVLFWWALTRFSETPTPVCALSVNRHGLTLQLSAVEFLPDQRFSNVKRAGIVHPVRRILSTSIYTETKDRQKVFVTIEKREHVAIRCTICRET